MAAIALGVICGIFLIGVPIGVLIGAVILRAATKWVTKINLGFGKAMLIVFCTAIVAGVINGVIGALVGMTMGAMRADRNAVQLVANLISLPFSFLIYSAAYGTFIRYPAPAYVVPATGQWEGSPGDGPASLSYETPQPSNGSGEAIGFGKGALVTLASWLIMFAIALVVGGVVLIVVLATRLRV